MLMSTVRVKWESQRPGRLMESSHANLEYGFCPLRPEKKKKNSTRTVIFKTIQQFIHIGFHEDDWHTSLSNKINTCKSSLTHHIQINIYYL